LPIGTPICAHCVLHCLFRPPPVNREKANSETRQKYELNSHFFIYCEYYSWQINISSINFL
jgi:hypothetical protein